MKINNEKLSQELPTSSRGSSRSPSPTAIRTKSKESTRNISRSLPVRIKSRSHSCSPRESRRPKFADPSDNPTPSRCLGVFGLSLRTRERDLYDIFNRHGDIEDITLIYDNYTGRSRGFGFVYYRHVEDARIAKKDTHNLDIDGRTIRVDFSFTDRAHNPTPGVYMGRPSYRGGGRGGGRGSGRGGNFSFRGGREIRRFSPQRRSRHRYSRSRSRSPSYARR